jgi:RimJ/RimL family protein N-acetyltransferase
MRPRVLVTTPRLHLRPASAVDVDTLTTLNAEPGVRRFLFDDQQWSREQNVELVVASQAQYEAEGTGLFVVTMRATGVPIGWVAYWYFHEPPALELGYALSEGYWRQGIATEASLALMTYGADRLGMTSFRASTDAPNDASIRVLERLGFTCVRRGPGRVHETLHFFRDGLPSVSFAVGIEMSPSLPPWTAPP